MKQDRIWKLIAAAAVVGLFYVGTALHGIAGEEAFGRAAHAQVIGPALTQEGNDVLITTSACGTRLYIWTFGPWNLENRRIPEYRGEVVGPVAPRK